MIGGKKLMVRQVCIEGDARSSIVFHGLSKVIAWAGVQFFIVVLDIPKKRGGRVA